MSDTCPTVRVKHEASPDGFCIINESDFDPAVHVKIDEPIPPPPPFAAVPPPPGPVDPLADLAVNWKDGDVAGLKKLAASVSGRAVENKAQAIEVIEAALKARATA